MRILYVSRATFPSEVTHTLSLMRMCQVLADQQHRVLLLGLRSTATEPPASEYFDYYGVKSNFELRTFYYASRLLELPLHARNARRAFDNFKPDLIYARLCVLPLALLPSETPLVFEMHNPGPVGQAWPQRKSIERIVFARKRVRIVVTTEVLRRYLLDRYPKLDVVVARLSAERPIPTPANELARFQEQQLPGNAAFRVGYTGALDRVGLRGIHIIAEIAAKMPDIDFHVVGGKSDLVAYWKQQAQHPNLFFHGHQNPNLMPWYLRSFDVLLAPVQLQSAKSAPFGRNLSPLKLSQYFAYGCAIVGSDLSSHHELIENGENGLLVKADAVEEWVAAIRRLQSDNELRKRLQQAAAATYEAGFTPERRLQTILRGLQTSERV